MTIFLLIGIIALSISVVLLCVSVIKLQRKTVYYDFKVDEFNKHIDRFTQGQSSLWNYVKHETKKIESLEEILNKTKSKTNADVFYDSFGFNVPTDMYCRYSGFWNAKYVERK